MTATSSGSGLQRTFFGLATLVLAVAALNWARSVLIPLALAILLTFILAPAVAWLERRHIRRAFAVIAVVALVFVILGGLGYVVTVQMGQLANQLTTPVYKEKILNKVAALRQNGEGVIGKLIDMGKELSDKIRDVNDVAAEAGARPEAPAPAAPSTGPDLTWLTGYAGSAAEGLATGALVIVLVLFMLAKREDLRDRLIRLLGKGHLTQTTRALDEAGQRISRYLLTLVCVNVTYGIVIAVGLSFIGVPYALVWGFLGGTLRFVPYIGIWVASVLPITLSAATADGWVQPLEVLGFIGVIELGTANFIEPTLFGRSMGVSEVALLVAAAFWAWLWGPIGLVLSAPLTVCVAVLGKYMPGLQLFEVLLKDEPVLDPPVRYYQRLLARDEDEAVEAVEEYLTDHPWEAVFDELLLPAVRMARRDRERGDLGAEEQHFILNATRDVLDDLMFRHQQSSAAEAEPRDGEERPKALVFAYPAHDETDELALHMLRLLLESNGARVEVFSTKSLASEVIRRAGEEHPACVIVGALPPGGMAQTRHLCKRLRAQHPDVKIAVGRWGTSDDVDKLRTTVLEAGADLLSLSLRETSAQVEPLLRLTPARAAAEKPAALQGVP